MSMTPYRERNEREARNDSMKHVARLYLAWFEQEAPKDAKFTFNDSGLYVYPEYYVHSDTEYRAMEFVSKLARERLSYAEANQTIEWAQKLVRGETRMCQPTL
jgi:hypothetical protein